MNAARFYRHQWTSIHIPIWISALLVFFWLASQWMPMPPKEITISTGRAGGMYQEHALLYQKALLDFGIQAKLLESAGTGQNIQRLKDNASGVQVGFIQGGYALSEANTTLNSGIETIAQVDVEPVWVFSRFRDVDSLLRLQGARVSIGQSGSGSRLVATRLLEQVRLEPKDLVLSETVGMETVAALRDGRIDATIFVAAANAPVVQALLKTPGVYLALLKRSAALTERMPYLDARFVAAGSLNFSTQQPAQDAVLLSTLASVVVREDLHPLIKRALTDAAIQTHSAAGPLHLAGEFPNLKRAEFSSAIEARDVLRNGMPWLEKTLGVYFAQWAYRILFIGLPLILIAFVLTRMVPGYLRWLMESGINRWYGELKFIENDLKNNKPGGLEVARFRGQLQQIEQEVNTFQPPRSYMQRMYQLRQHILFVKAELGSSKGR
jgi:uncharacterized protein